MAWSSSLWHARTALLWLEMANTADFAWLLALARYSSESGPLLSLAGRHSTIRGPDADDPLALAASLVDRLFGAGGGGGCRTGALAFSEDALELVVPFALASLTSASDLRMTVRVDCGG